MGAADIVGRRVGYAPVFDFPFRDQLFHGLRYHFGLDFRVNAVLVEQINVICLQAFERTV